MDLIDNDEACKICVTGVGLLAHNDIPFLQSGNDNLGFGNLLLHHLGINSEFTFDGENL